MGSQNHFLLVTALAEGAVGLLLLLLPGVLMILLVGPTSIADDALFMGRVGGSALLAIGVTSWFARNDSRSTPAPSGVLPGLLVYNAVAALIFALAGPIWSMGGVLLWPVVAVHGGMFIWCVACMWGAR